MKRKWLGLALAAVMACAGAATGTEYTDNSGNYPEGWNNGTNGGEGFGAWKIVEMSGSFGWVGHGLWDPSDNAFKGTWDGKTQAFGMIGKGAGFSVTASRAFRKALAEGDSFQLDMGVNWDANIDGAHKGFVLTAGGKDILEINHGNYPGHIYLNGDDSCDVWNEAPNQELGEPLYPMTWKFTVKDATTLTISANSRKDAETVYEKDFEVETSAIDGFRLQSIEQDNQDENRRQSYYDNFVLDVEGPLPDLHNLTLAEKNGEWAVTTADPTNLTFVVGRDTIEGEVAVRIASSDPFVELSSDEVVLADGVDSIEVPATATLYANANLAAITVEAVGYTSPAEPWEIKGPKYDWDADAWQLNDGQACTLWVNHWPSVYPDGDDGLISVTSSDSSVVKIELNEDWKTDTENPQHTYASWKVTAVGGGKATANVSYDGVELGTWGFEVVESGATLSGPTALHIGDEATYKLDVTLAGDIESDTFQLVADDDSLVSISPEVAQELTESGTLEFKVTALAEGEVTLSVVDDKGLDVNIAPITVVITEAPDYSDYIAYDDASFYEAGPSLDFSATGVGIDGFGPWGIYKDSAEFGGVFVGGDAGGFPAILTEGQTFGIYANGSNPDYAIFRPFVTDEETGRPKDLQPGQKASVEFVVPESTGVLYAQFARVWDGVPYSRFEVYVDNYNVGVNVSGAAGSEALDWSAEPRRIVASVQRAADGSDYTLDLVGYNEAGDVEVYQHVVNADVGEWYDGIQGIVIGVYNMGGGENMPFNKLAVTQEEEPVPPTPPAATMNWTEGVWNPDELGVEYTFTLSPSEVGAIGLVDLSLNEGAEGAELSPVQIDLSEGPASFTFTLTGDTLPSGTEYTITAKAQAEGVDDATYGLTVWEPSSMLVTANGEYEYDYVPGGTVEFQIYGTPSYVGKTVDLDSDDEDILAPPESKTAVVVPYYSKDGAFSYTMSGVKEGQTWVHAYHEGTKWGEAGITIHGTAPDEGPAIDGTTVMKVSFANGFSAEATEEFKAQFSGVKAQRLEWDGKPNTGFEPVGPVLLNQAAWPEMKFDLDDPNAVLRLIFVP